MQKTTQIKQIINKVKHLKTVFFGLTLPTAKGTTIKTWWTIIEGKGGKIYFSGRLAVEELQAIYDELEKMGKKIVVNQQA